MAFYLTEDDRLILRESAGDCNVFTKWYFGYELMPGQWTLVHATQPNILLLGGRGGGKTWGPMLGAPYWCVMAPGFRYLNTSLTSDQAFIPFELFCQLVSENEKFAKFLADEPKKKPFPHIIFFNGSRMDFKTVGREEEAVTKRGFEYDWINIDEGGYVSAKIVAVLRSCLRGTRIPTKEPRLGRLSITTTPTAEEWVAGFWEKGQAGRKHDPHYLSLRMKTEDNIHLTEQDVYLMRDLYTAEEARVELDAELPDVQERTFPHRHIVQCEDRTLNEQLDKLMAERNAETKKHYDQHWGLLRFELPPEKGHVYILAGDPGTGNPPYRGAGVCMVFDITDVPAKMVALWWVSGHGAWEPWLSAFKFLLGKYNPILRGIDVSGAQTFIEEREFRRHGVDITGIQMSHRKDILITALQLFLERRRGVFPFIQGLRSQLGHYKPQDKKLAQDLVMTLGEIALLLQTLPAGTRGTRRLEIGKTRRKVRSRRKDVRSRRSR